MTTNTENTINTKEVKVLTAKQQLTLDNKSRANELANLAIEAILNDDGLFNADYTARLDKGANINNAVKGSVRAMFVKDESRSIMRMIARTVIKTAKVS